jgi:hypothetical protein
MSTGLSVASAPALPPELEEFGLVFLITCFGTCSGEGLLFCITCSGFSVRFGFEFCIFISAVASAGKAEKSTVANIIFSFALSLLTGNLAHPYTSFVKVRIFSPLNGRIYSHIIVKYDFDMDQKPVK